MYLLALLMLSQRRAARARSKLIETQFIHLGVYFDLCRVSTFICESIYLFHPCAGASEQLSLAVISRFIYFCI